MGQTTPKRTCIGCGKQGEKQQFIRIVRTKDGEITLDQTGKKNGRGAYICLSKDCLAKAVKSRGLDRAFRVKVPDCTYDQLIKEMENLEQ